MKDEAKRKEFEKAEWKFDARDGLYCKLQADPDCKTCNGHGLVDVGHYACMLDDCPDCWLK